MSTLLHVSHPETCNSLVTTVLGLSVLSNRERLVSETLTLLGWMVWTAWGRAVVRRQYRSSVPQPMGVRVASGAVDAFLGLHRF